MWYNTFMIWLLKSSFHGMISSSIMSINYRGRRSGKLYNVPVNYHQDGDKLIVFSDRDRYWWRNMKTNHEVTVQLRGLERQAVAVAVDDLGEVEVRLQKYLISAPRMARYFKVSVDDEGNPSREDVAKAARKHVVILVEVQ